MRSWWKRKRINFWRRLANGFVLHARTLDKCDICGLYGEDIEEFCEECPCGRYVCNVCQDNSIYGDQMVCVTCAAETRADWKACPGHVYDLPHWNDDGDEIQECGRCGHPKLVRSYKEVTP